MIEEKLQKVLAGGSINADEALALVNHPDKEAFYQGSERITRHFMGKVFDSCSIINAKSGNCSEDCKWCAQSHRCKLPKEIYPLVEIEESLRYAKLNESQGIGRFSLVTSGRKPNPKELEKIGEHYKAIRRECSIKRCASLGLLNEEEFKYLKSCGVDHYHCNLETAPSYFGHLCSTHTTEEKIRTLKAARSAGMELCSGGIIGMGETMEQRIELAQALHELDVHSIPINFLVPIPGTELEKAAPLTPEEILDTIAIFRWINPKAFLRFSGGRALLDKDLQHKCLKIGINAAIMGDLLTTIGSKVEEDKQMIKAHGYEMANDIDWGRN